jgi:HPt (histidine-containing phosphotransfer) domain-containing protein
MADLKPTPASSDATAAPKAPETAGSPSAELDMRLLRELGDDTPDGLSREIERFLTSFDMDRQAAHATAASGDRKRLFQIAHRLLGHSSAVHHQVLMHLAEKIQSQAALLEPAELKQLLEDFDRGFASLRSKLDALRASIERG